MQSDRQKPTVLIVFSSDKVGGAEASLSRMASRMGLLNTVFCFSGQYESPLTDFLRARNLHLRFFSQRNRFFKFLSLISLNRLIREIRPSVVYVSGFKLMVFLKLTKIFMPKYKLVMAVRWNPRTNHLLDILTRFSERHFGFLTDFYITNSSAAKQTLIERAGVPKDKICVILNGIPEDFFVQKLPQYSSRTVTLIANMGPRKGLDVFLGQLHSEILNFPNWKLNIVGRDDGDRSLERIIGSLSLSAKVFHLGFCREVRPVLLESQVFILPSRSEGAPTSVLEAMAIGLPVVAFDVDGLGDLVIDGETGFLIPAFDYELFFQKICCLLDRPEVCQEMGGRARSRVQKEFSLKTCAEAHEEIFLKLLSNDTSELNR